MSDKMDVSDIVWSNIDEEVFEYMLLYEDIVSPQGWSRLNPFAWISYFRKKHFNNIIGAFILDDSVNTNEYRVEFSENGEVSK